MHVKYFKQRSIVVSFLDFLFHVAVIYLSALFLLIQNPQRFTHFVRAHSGGRSVAPAGQSGEPIVHIFVS
jgi:hypothetical protein